MKKIFLAISMVTLFAAGAAAQGVSGGIKGGANFANLKGDDIEESEMKVGYHLGGYLNVAFTDAFSLQPEVLYNTVGTKNSESDFTEKLNLSYVSVPVMLVYSFGTVNIQAGPQFSFLTAAKYEAEEGGDSMEVDLKDDMNGTDIGFNIGLGANFGKFNAAARYCIGLSNIPDDEDADMKNSVIQLSLGVKLFGE